MPNFKQGASTRLITDAGSLQGLALSQIIAGIQRRRELEIEKNKAGQGLIAWGRHYLPHYFSLSPSEQHTYLADLLESAATTRNQHIVIEGPRGSAKSTIATLLYPLYAICEGKESYIVIVSETFDQAKKLLRCIKHELETNSKLAEHYPDAVGEGKTWDATSISTRNNIRVEALGCGTKLRGRREQEHRVSCLICDDPESDISAMSPLVREHRREWFFKDALKAGGPGSNFIVVGTRLHNDCLTARLCQTPGWISKTFRAIMQWPLNMDLWAKWELIFADAEIDNTRREKEARQFYEDNKAAMDEGAKVLWEPLENLYQLMSSRAQGHASFESEKQNNPMDPTKCEWPPHLFEGELYFNEWPLNPDLVLIACDPSRGAVDKSGDYCGIILMMKKGNLIYVDADLQKRDLDGITRALMSHYLSFHPTMIAIESDQCQNLIGKELLRAGDEMKLMLPVVGLPTEGVKKTIRIARLSPLIHNRSFRFKHKSPGVAILLKQLQEFPHSDHDDGPDALEQGVRLLNHVLIAQQRENITTNLTHEASSSFSSEDALDW